MKGMKNNTQLFQDVSRHTAFITFAVARRILNVKYQAIPDTRDTHDQ